MAKLLRALVALPEAKALTWQLKTSVASVTGEMKPSTDLHGFQEHMGHMHTCRQNAYTGEIIG